MGSDIGEAVIPCSAAVLGRGDDKFRDFHCRAVLELLDEIPVGPTSRGAEFVTTSGQFSLTKGETCVKLTDLMSVTR